MDIEADIDQPVTQTPPPSSPRIPPATFRGTDCAVLAERYAEYRRNMLRDMAPPDPDLIVTAAAAAEPAIA